MIPLKLQEAGATIEDIGSEASMGDIESEASLEDIENEASIEEIDRVLFRSERIEVQKRSRDKHVVPSKWKSNPNKRKFESGLPYKGKKTRRRIEF